MKHLRYSLLHAAPCALLLWLFGCSSESPGGMTGSGGAPNPSTGGAPSSGGTVAATGGSSSATGGSTSSGGSSGGITAMGGRAESGGTSSGGNAAAGASGHAGSSGAGGSNAGASSGGAGASSGGAGGVGSGGQSGAAGSAGAAAAGAGGDSSDPAAELNGKGWTMKCTKPDTDGSNRCYLLPPGKDTCPQNGYTSVDETIHFGGKPGTIYDVTIHFRGTHEAGDYQGGTAKPAQFLKGATHQSGGLHTWLSMEVSSPAATYNPNSGGGAGSVQVYDYTATIQIEGGATIKLKGSDIDCLMHRYCQPGTNTSTVPCKGLVVEGVSPADKPIDGAFLQMEVTSVTPKN